MLCESLLANVAVIVITVLTLVITYFKWSYQYWKRRNVPYLEPKIPFGNSVSPFGRKESSAERFKRYYDTMKANGWKHGGMYMGLKPHYVLIDLDYLRNVLTKDFQYFTDRGLFYNEEDDPLSAHLFAIGGVKWRNLRTKLTPTFTTGKMKMMFQTLVDCVPNLMQQIEADCVKGAPIDIKEAVGCFTTDIIGSCAFGLDCKSFEEPDSPFRKYGTKFFNSSPFGFLKMMFCFNFPNVAKKLRLKLIPTDTSDFFINLVKNTVEERQNKNIHRKDFLQLLMDLENNKAVDDDGHKYDGTSLTIEEMAAQGFVFFIAGFETSSTTATFALYELSRNQDIQEKLRKEVNHVLEKFDGKITYDAIQEMKYMDLVINETLRKYPPVTIVSRQCVKDYKVPDCDVIIEKGIRAFIPIYAIHHDPEYYPEPEKFDPERFNEENRNRRHHFAHIPFGEGPRLCIGMRFGLMQTKVALASLLKNYKFTVNNKTREPLKMKVHSFVLAAEGEVWLSAHKISKA